MQPWVDGLLASPACPQPLPAAEDEASAAFFEEHGYCMLDQILSDADGQGRQNHRPPPPPKPTFKPLFLAPKAGFNRDVW